jgi:transcriptional regulator of heat shock response
MRLVNNFICKVQIDDHHRLVSISKGESWESVTNKLQKFVNFKVAGFKVLSSLEELKNSQDWNNFQPLELKKISILSGNDLIQQEMVTTQNESEKETPTVLENLQFKSEPLVENVEEITQNESEKETLLVQGQITPVMEEKNDQQEVEEKQIFDSNSEEAKLESVVENVEVKPESIYPDSRDSSPMDSKKSFDHEISKIKFKPTSSFEGSVLTSKEKVLFIKLMFRKNWKRFVQKSYGLLPTMKKKNQSNLSP